MPTSSSERPSTAPHEARRIAESFGSDAARYDRARPPYPEALMRRIAETAPGPDVLDVGCGTGIAARQLQVAGCRVLGVEPDARMADFARDRGTAVEAATFEDWAPAGRTFDAVVAATAWHWVDPVAGSAKAARILRPGGLFAAFWHVFRLPPDLADSFVGAYRRAVPDSPIDPRAATSTADAYETIFAKVADGLGTAGGFGAPQKWPFAWERAYTRAEWLDQLSTTGALTALRPDQRAEVLRAVGAAIDADGGSFVMPYTTVAVTAIRTAS
ncbi:methyltransferase family protein [Actinocorallia herbida]|uniref:Methyltransferase family protein n=1 Tax=Actinocorallia herbida TaxID=58109 RepID=A0A3N1CUF1_9ACTN|nr:class I SAM-dependent methyltransferase [Actinocorallia herbida]ROO84939.1 methyltransferase family protein [Actinocorallia herbida]